MVINDIWQCWFQHRTSPALYVRASDLARSRLRHQSEDQDRTGAREPIGRIRLSAAVANTGFLGIGVAAG